MLLRHQNKIQHKTITWYLILLPLVPFDINSNCKLQSFKMYNLLLMNKDFIHLRNVCQQRKKNTVSRKRKR